MPQSPIQDLLTSALDYDLPQELIARRPVEPRDSARLMVVSRADTSGARRHSYVRDLPDHLKPGDALVINETRVVPARIIGRRSDTGGRIDGLFLHADQPDRWRVMLRSNGKLRSGQRIELLDANENAAEIVIELIDRQDATWRVRVNNDQQPAELLSRIGRTPLPPYILHARAHEPQDGARSDSIADDEDRRWYQTVYAASRAASVAAPTAGLHFTPGLLEAIAERGVSTIPLTLDVGPGTFRPVTAERLAEHQMHEEHFEISARSLGQIAETRRSGGRVFAVGTTSMRALESLPDDLDALADQLGDRPHRASTSLLIAPGYAIRHVDGLLTNFHLPRSTLLALVAAMIGLDRTHTCYAQAVAHSYRFYSYGDAMLILP